MVFDMMVGKFGQRIKLLVRLLVRKFWRYIGIGICTTILAISLAIFLGWNAPPSIAQNPTANPVENPINTVQIGKQHYQLGEYAKAIAAWQHAADIYTKQGDRLNQAVVFQNLALAHQQLGQWQDADRAIAVSLEILPAQATPQATRLLAQALNIQGNIQFTQGNAQEALNTWQIATATYEQLGDRDGAIRSKINQSQALRSLGLYPKAKVLLKQVQTELNQFPDSLLKAASLLNLADTLRLSGDFSEAIALLQKSLAIAQNLKDAPTITEILITLGNIASSQQQATSSGNIQYRSQKQAEAIAYYQQAFENATNPLPKVQAQLNQLRLQIEAQQMDQAKILLPIIQTQLQNLPPSRALVYAKVNFSQSLIKLSSAISDRQAAAELLSTAAQEAKKMSDPRTESYAIGYLGRLYEQSQQLSDAQGLTEKALILAQTNSVPNIAYRWQWQLGRILKAKGENVKAIAAYSEAVKTLTSIRGDLVSSNIDIQFSFRDSVEPVYRELVALLLTPAHGKAVSPENIKAARQAIESLQLAELDNFFKEACLTVRPTQVDEIDRQAAVIYPIILPDSLAVIISLPDRSLLLHTTAIAQTKLEDLLSEMRRSLRRTAIEQDIQAVSQKVYNILIGKEIEATLAAHQIKTLAFVLDGSLRNLPMAVLYDGKQYLMEKYNLALTPSLELLDPRPLKYQSLEVFVGGLSKTTQNFAPLPNVERELQQIAAVVSSQAPLLNETFIDESIQKQISKTPFRVVHLATHGEFSSDINKTFLLTWNHRLGVKQLGEMLQTRDQDIRIPIELLVLSACKTAKGDNRAALGLAGIAISSGARSTIASLWSVEDSATATFMVKFYQDLATVKTTKAQALRRAQIALLQDPQFTHPFYWAPFILVGNWL